MKKLLISGVFINAIFSAQVGVNTKSPKATFDILGKPTDINVQDGIIIPRLTGDQLKAKDASYTLDQNGAMVFVTEPVTSSSSKTALVISHGIYFYDAIQTRWRRLVTSIPLSIQAFNGQRNTVSSTTVNPGIIRTLDFPNVNITISTEQSAINM